MTRFALLLGAALVFLFALAAPARAAAVSFTVVDEAGKPVAGAEVGLFSTEDVVSAKTDAAGKARIGDVPADEWTAWAAADGYTGEEQDVTVGDEPAVAVRFVLGPGIAFSGRVVDGDGRPVADAYVEAVAGGSFEGYGEWKSRPPYDRVYAAEDGTFRIRGIPSGAVSTLVVTSEGFRETRFAVRAQGDGVRPSPVVIILDRGGVVAGTVLDPEGKPVEGATVLVVPADEPDFITNPWLKKWGSDGKTVMALTAESGPGGRFSLSGLALGEAVVALAAAPGYALSLPSNVFVPGEGRRGIDLVLRLRKPAALVLKVSGPGGVPVEKGRVRLGDPMGGLPDRDAPDEPGIFRYPALPPGEVRIRIEAEGFLPRDLTATLEAGKEKVVEVVLEAGAVVSGTVRDRAGKPVAGATVRLERQETRPDGWTQFTSGTAETDAEGRFEVRGLTPGRHELHAYLPGDLVLLEVLPVEAPAKGLELVLDRLPAVRMKLTAPEGLTLPDRVFVWEWKEGGGSGSGRDLENGLLVLRGRYEDSVTLEVRVTGYVPLRREVTVPIGETLDLGEVALDPGVTLRGTVTDQEGKAVPGARVFYGEGMTPVRESVSRADGAFELPHLPAGKVELAVEAEGYLPFEGEAAVGKDAAPAVLKLRRGALVTGRLVDGKGAPLADHWIQFRSPPVKADDPKGEFLDETGTEDDGTFEMRLPEGPCRILFVTEEKIHVLAELKLVEGGREEVKLVLDAE